MDGVASFGKYAFYCCYNLSSITIPISVESIGSDAFNRYYSFISFTITDDATLIGSWAFGSCKGLTSILGFCNSLQSIDVDQNNNYYKSEDGVLFSKKKKKRININTFSM